ncbi:caspase domain-containing protein [Prosthecobacter sp.]|uniref:caspase domain-containing protein n=1 Tax=Prosthecobacter sp. TaxID=1965333 RepID=UPI003784BB95
MKLWTAFLACLYCIVASAGERHALVIGNSHYPADGLLVTPLDNCIPDARLITSTLRSIGFKVTLVEDASKSAMDDALLAWEEKLPKGCDALVYFAGHGIEHNGKNYLLGTNSKLKAQSRIGEEALEAETLAVAMLLAGAKSSFLFLDCCREAPPAEWVTRGLKKRGLADVKVDGDIIIAYAAKPGEGALDQPVVSGDNVLSGNGPYAQALVKFLSGGLKHTDFFQQVRKEVARLTGGKQRTWENGSFLEEFYFSAPSNTPSSNKAQNASPQRDFMLIEVGDKPRKISLIPAEELARLRISNPDLKAVNRAFRLDLTSKDIGKHIQGFSFEARNDFGVPAVFYDGSEGTVEFAKVSKPSIWRQSGNIKDMLAYPLEYIAGRRRFNGGKNGYPLLAGDLTAWTMMKEDAWLMLLDPGVSVSKEQPIFTVSATAQLFLSKDAPPNPQTEAVLIYYK